MIIHWTELDQGTVVRFCEHGDELLDSIKESKEYSDQMNNSQLFRNKVELPMNFYDGYLN